MEQKQLNPELFLWILTSPSFTWDNLCKLAELCDCSANKTDQIVQLLWPDEFQYGEYYWQWRSQCWEGFVECWEDDQD